MNMLAKGNFSGVQNKISLLSLSGRKSSEKRFCKALIAFHPLKLIHSDRRLLFKINPRHSASYCLLLLIILHTMSIHIYYLTINGIRLLQMLCSQIEKNQIKQKIEVLRIVVDVNTYLIYPDSYVKRKEQFGA